MGFFLRSLFPVIKSWIHDPSTPATYPRWWAALLFAALICLVAGVINSNLPVKPREILKSIILGFALDSAKILDKIAGP
jgi:hypothetical protein